MLHHLFRSVWIILFLSNIFPNLSYAQLAEVEGNLLIRANHAGGISIQQEIGNAQQLNWKDRENKTIAAFSLNNPADPNAARDMRWYFNGADRLLLDDNGSLRLGGFGTAHHSVNLALNGTLAVGTSFDAVEPPANGALIEGRLGIGVSDPESQFHVRSPGGESMVFETLSDGFIGLRTSNTTAGYFTGISSGQYTIFDVSAGPRFNINSDGHIGIGTLEPQGKLHIEDGSIVVNSPSFNSDLFLRNTNSDITGDGITGTILRHHAIAGLGVFDVIDGEKQVLPMLSVTPGLVETRVNSAGHALIVTNENGLSGSKGIQVELKGSALSPNNNFMTFTQQGNVRGKIHGQETLTTLSRDAINDLLGSSPVQDDDTAASTSRNQGVIAGNDNAFFNFIGSNYGQDLCWHTIEFIESIIVLIANSFSVLDPDDFAACSYEVISRGIKLWAFIAIEELTAGIAYESEGADYAEWLRRYERSEKLGPGDVVGVIGGQVSKSFTKADKFMVVSYQPMVLGNMPEVGAEGEYEKIAFIGQVPVKTIGEVLVGDYILPSGNGDGLAISVTPDRMKTKDYDRIIGIAWSKSDSSKHVNLINTAVGINANDMANTVAQMQQMMNTMQLALQKLDPSFQVDLYEIDGGFVTSQKLKDYSTSATLNGVIKNELHHDLISHNSSIDEQRQVVFSTVKQKLEAQGFDFGDFPYLAELFEHPTEEKLLEAKEHYEHVIEKMGELATNFGK